jgi:hypothetical protein
MCVHHLSLVGWLSVGESPAVSSYSRGEFICLAVHGKHRHPLAKGCGNWFKSYTCDYLRVYACSTCVIAKRRADAQRGVAAPVRGSARKRSECI